MVCLYRTFAAICLALLLASPLPAASTTAFAASDEVQFGIANPAFADYFQKRGGLRTFGYPISRQFALRGSQVQMFQRGIMQLTPGGGVGTMNLLDSGLMPYTSFNFSVVPGPQRELMDTAPSPTDIDYASKAVAFATLNAVDSWQGLPVNFGRTFLSTVRLEDAFPDGKGDPGLVPLLNLEIWGLPTSRPTFDPNNHRFVYQRFQRGIMHFDVETGATQGLLLGDYLKAIITGAGLPSDLEGQAAESPFYRQYGTAAMGPLRRADLPDSDLTSAFQPGTGDPRFGVVVMGPGSDDSLHLASALAELGAGSFFSFGKAGEVPGKVELVRPGADFVEVAARAKANPGRTWLVGNEPNVIGQDDVATAAYADFLAASAQAIRAADPSARMVGPNVLNWDKTCDGCPGYRSGHSWSDEFLRVFRQKYGALPLDAWGMHT